MFRKNTTKECSLRKESAWKSFSKELSKNKILFLMLLPATLYVFIFHYLPMGGAIVAFKDFKYDLGILRSPWVGLENFRFFFESGKLWELTKNTLSYNTIFLVVGTITKIFTAIIIAEMGTKYYKRVLQSVMMLPHFLSWVIIGGLFYNLFNYEYGAVNMLLKEIGLAPLDVYNDTTVWKPILTFVKIWHETGYGMIFYLAAITGINRELYEAAYVDGAGLLKRIWYITLPLMMPTTITLLLLSLGGIIKGNMDMFYQIVGTNAKLYSATDVIDTYVFRSLTQLRDFTVTSAAGLYQQVIGCALVLTTNTIVKKIDKESALF